MDPDHTSNCSSVLGSDIATSQTGVSLPQQRLSTCCDLSIGGHSSPHVLGPSLCITVLNDLTVESAPAACDRARPANPQAVNAEEGNISAAPLFAGERTPAGKKTAQAMTGGCGAVAAEEMRTHRGHARQSSCQCGVQPAGDRHAI